ncbi:MAG: M20/M25/M40 family metallo-hydrolase [Candidatus Wallbacteria bacterium]|nr:M20/M25/M40 family metallo-hydrolase [Candidatus Wallbacteria bacterium]
MVNRERLVKNFMELVKIDSLSLKEKKVAEFAAAQLRKLGFEVKFDNAHKPYGGETGNLIAYKKGDRKKKGVAIVAHMDTVVPGEHISPRIEKGLIKSDGNTILGADDKAGIAAMIEAARILSEQKISHGPVYFIMTIGEEQGLYGAKQLNLKSIKAEYFFILDSEGAVGRVVVSAPSQNSVNAEFIGKAAHAGVNPEDGINSIAAASKAISRMKLGRIDKETTANIGKIEGGMATNIVPEKTTIFGEARSRNEDKLRKQTEQMVKSIKEAARITGAKVKIMVKKEFGAFKLGPNHEIVKVVTACLKQIGKTISLESTGGGSDTNVFNSRGVQAVNLAVGMENVHTKKEQIKISELTAAAEMVLSLITFNR